MAETGSVIYLPDIVKISKIPHILIRDFFYNSWLGVIISSNSLPIFDIYGRVWIKLKLSSMCTDVTRNTCAVI